MARTPTKKKPPIDKPPRRRPVEYPDPPPEPQPSPVVVMASAPAMQAGPRPRTLAEIRANLPAASGLVCPGCGCCDLRPQIPDSIWKVVKTKKISGAIRRIRVCRNCGRHVSTMETIGTP